MSLLVTGNLESGTRARRHRQVSNLRAIHALGVIVGRVGALALGLPTAVLTVALALVCGAGFGLGRIDGDLWVRMAISFPGNPHLPANYGYLLSSPIGPAVAHLLRIRTVVAYQAMSFVVLLAAVALTALGLHRRVGRSGAALGLIALFASPLSMVLPIWLQKEDPFVLLGAALLVLFDRPTLVAAGAVVLATANPPIAVFAVIAVGGLALTRRETGARRRAAASVAGLALGVALVAAYDLNVGTGLVGRASFIQQVGLGGLVHQMAEGFIWWLPGFFILSAVLVIALGEDRLPRGARRVLACVVAVALAMTVLSEDETRIYALLMWPIVLWVVKGIVGSLSRAGLARLCGALLVVGLVMPRIMVAPGMHTVFWLGQLRIVHVL